MSTRGIDAFLDRLSRDDGFRSRVGEALKHREDIGAATVELGREAGFEFTVEQLDDALDARYGSQELSEAQLDRVAAAGLTVGANLLGVMHETSSGLTLAFPDVCKTPSPGGPIPIPYPNVGTAPTGGSTKGTKGR